MLHDCVQFPELACVLHPLEAVGIRAARASKREPRRTVRPAIGSFSQPRGHASACACVVACCSGGPGQRLVDCVAGGALEHGRWNVLARRAAALGADGPCGSCPFPQTAIPSILHFRRIHPRLAEEAQDFSRGHVCSAGPAIQVLNDILGLIDAMPGAFAWHRRHRASSVMIVQVHSVDASRMLYLGLLIHNPCASVILRRR